MQDRNRILIRLGKSSWKTLIWESQHHSLTMFVWVALKENVRLVRILWMITKTCSNQGFLPGLQKNCQKQRLRGNLMPKRYLHGPMTWKDTQRIAWKDVANMRIKQLSNCTKSQRHGWMIINFKEEEMGSVGELSKVCSQVVLKCLNLERIGRPDMLWSVNKLARAVTKLTQACDKRLARLISYIHHTCEHRQYCYVGKHSTTLQIRIVFRDSDFAGDFEDSKSTSGGILCIFGSHTFVSISWMCKKQTSVSHSSTEAEVISLRMDGIPALDLWDLVIVILDQNKTNTTKEVRATEKAVGKSSTKHAKTNSNHEHQSRSDQYWSRSIKRNTFRFQCYVVRLWGSWSRDWDDNQRPKSHNETCVKNRQSCFGLVVWPD